MWQRKLLQILCLPKMEENIDMSLDFHFTSSQLWPYYLHHSFEVVCITLILVYIKWVCNRGFMMYNSELQATQPMEFS